MNRNDLENSIRMALLQTSSGFSDNVSIVCPSCGGGKNHEASMSVNVLTKGYICYRARCGTRGYLGGHLRIGVRDTGKQQPTVQLDSRPSTSVLANCPESIRARSSYPLGTSKGRVAFQIRGPSGELGGYVLRSYSGVTPKCLTIRMGYNGMHFPARSLPVRDTIVLVEDVPSADAVSMVHPAAALLGTSVTKEYCQQIQQLGIRTVHLALDPDATAKAAAILRKHLFADFRFIPLDKDPKDMVSSEIAEVFGNLYEVV